MKLSKPLSAALLAGALMVTLSACEQDGPLEDAGEEIDDAAEDAGEGIEDATDGN